MDLEDGWDGEDAKPVSLEAVVASVALIYSLSEMYRDFEAPFVAPTFNGYLLLDWTNKARTLEAKLTPTGWSIVGTKLNPDGNNEYLTAQCKSGDPRMQEYYRWFRGDTSKWPIQ